jgi:rhodanese-related sulfurtransferase
VSPTPSRSTVRRAAACGALACALPLAAHAASAELCAQATTLSHAVECVHDAAGRAALPVELSPRQVWALKQRFGAGVVLIDVRMPVETQATGSPVVTDHVVQVRMPPPGADPAKPLPSSALVDDPAFVENFAQTLRLSAVQPDAPIVLICRTGNRSQIALRRLRAAGYTNVSEVIGGMDGKPNALDDDEMGWRATQLPILRFVDPPL